MPGSETVKKKDLRETGAERTGLPCLKAGDYAASGGNY